MRRIDDVAAQPNAAGRRRRQAGDDVEKRRFPATRWAYKRYKLLLTNAEGDILASFMAVRAESFAQPLDD